ncbi:MAG: glycogen synthase GlgA [Clostridia bacterium]|nr:glycogen synthase GlgA [Clostridia bacterium]
MKVLFVTSECVPFVKTGGLGDVAGALPRELKRQGVDVRVIMPRYEAIGAQYKEQMRYIDHIYIKMGWRSQYCGVFELEHNGVIHYFVDNLFYFGASSIYGPIAEDIERFAFFDKAVLALLQVVDFFPDVIHANDWQSGMVSVLLRAHYGADSRYARIKTIFTIHNLKFQGVYDKKTISDVCELNATYFTPDKLEFYKDASFLKGGVVYSDYITTVSPTYAGEIQNPFFGERLDGLLRARNNCLRGIINGVDYDEYNPRTDPLIVQTYNARDVVAQKKVNKVELQKELGLEVDENRFLIGMVTRLTAQKGMDLVDCVMDDICYHQNIQMVVLGTGERQYEDTLRFFEWKYGGRVSAQIRFDNTVAHKIYAASDAFLMPSLFEPCGLSQMIAMRYGTIPIVRETGGLRDTVEPFNEFENTGTGFSFTNYNAHEMLGIIGYAHNKFFDSKRQWQQMIKRAMAKDFSWAASAKEYIDLYASLL